MQRPHFQKTTNELAELCEGALARNDYNELRLLRTELLRRKRPKAVALRQKIDQFLRDSDNKKQQNDLFQHTPSAKPKPHTASELAPASPERRQRQTDTTAEKPPEMTNAGPVRLGPTSDNRTAPLEAGRETNQRSEGQGDNEDAPANDDADALEEVDEDSTLPESPKPTVRSKGYIRAPGHLTDVPEKWKPALDAKLRPSWSPDDPTVRRYEAALRALIIELRKRGSGAVQISLSNGQQLQADELDVGYQFAWDSDEQLFEGAKLEAIVDGTRTKGRVVALTSHRIIVAFETDFGPVVTACLLIVDNTALLEALADRLKALASGEQLGFNGALAEAVITNDGEEMLPGIVPAAVIEEHQLNDGQIEAVGKALTNSVSYLWGPPGTGKTSTLSAINQILFNANKRVLICSNTNQAVDQVLLKLCESLARPFGGDRKKSVPLDEGRIVRIGNIVPGGPLASWSDWVTVKGIAERRSTDLKARLQTLEEEAKRVTATVEAAQRTLSLFHEVDRLLTRRVCS